jgi:DnaJ family protein A protein 2
MPQHKRPFDKGSLFVKFDVQFPPSNWANPTQLKLLETILPPRPAIADFKGKIVDQVVLSSLNAYQQQKANAQAQEQYDEDHDERPGVQCAQQ